MLRETSVIVVSTFGFAVVLSAAQPELEIARRLADRQSRQATVRELTKRGKSMEPLLLRWTQHPPRQIDTVDLFLGLIDAFVALKTKEAIPFLVKQINLREAYDAVLHKHPQAIVESFPAIQALLGFGPEATPELLAAYRRPLTPDERTAVIVTLGQLRDPNARLHLRSIRAHAFGDLYRAEQGLALLGDEVRFTEIK